VQDFLGFFSTDTIEHFRDEEERVFPLLVDVVEAEGTLERVMTEHLRIHSAVRSLRRELAEGGPSPATILRVAALLESHIRYEEKVVFPLMETTLTPQLLENLSLMTRDTASL
jgi:iron-sulfur cluster repair protein YtfE (RIC family)